jgi:hypothetical protein
MPYPVARFIVCFAAPRSSGAFHLCGNPLVRHNSLIRGFLWLQTLDSKEFPLFHDQSSLHIGMEGALVIVRSFFIRDISPRATDLDAPRIEGVGVR